MLRSVLTKSSHSRDRGAAGRAGSSRPSARRSGAGVAGFTGGYVTCARVPEQAICPEISRLLHNDHHDTSRSQPAMSQSLLPWIRKVVVGSTNPVKIAAVRAVIARVAPEASVHAVDVASGVPDQPWGDDETQRGAAERARQALRLSTEADADLGVGIEGGVVLQHDGSVRTCAWAVASTRDGQTGTGGSLAMQLPLEVAALVIAGTELGHAMDQVALRVHTKRHAGAVGILTAGLIDRQRAYEPLVSYALAPFLAAEYFERRASGQAAVPPPAPADGAVDSSSDGR